MQKEYTERESVLFDDVSHKALDLLEEEYENKSEIIRTGTVILFVIELFGPNVSDEHIERAVEGIFKSIQNGLNLEEVKEIVEADEE